MLNYWRVIAARAKSCSHPAVRKIEGVAPVAATDKANLAFAKHINRTLGKVPIERHKDA